MIVRIATEDQYRLPDEDAERLNELDNQAVAAVEADDEDRFHEVFCADLSERQAEIMAATQRPATQEALVEPSGVRPQGYPYRRLRHGPSLPVARAAA